MTSLPSFLVAACLLAPAAHAGKSILFVAGPKSHGPGMHEHPAGCELLAKHLRDAKLELTVNVSLGWPQDSSLVAAADTLVIYGDGEGAHPAKDQLDALRTRHQAGKGLAVLHYALEPANPEMGQFLTQAIGGFFDPSFSVNPIWQMTKPLLATHPATSGVAPFEIEEEFYYHIRLRDDVTPLLRALPPASSLGNDGPRSGNPDVRKALADAIPQTLAWCVENPNKSRGFGFTGGHFHHHWANEDFRQLILNSILWTANADVPADGIATAGTVTPAHPTIDDAIARGDLADVKLHLTANPACLTKGGKPTSRPPLEQAILRNKTDIAIALLEAGADPNSVNASQRTPLHLTVDRNNPALAAALLKAGAKPDARDKDGWTPLHHAAAKNQVETAKVLLAGAANPMTLSELGGTPLHEAAASGGAEMIKLLLDAKVDPNLKSKENVTALDIAKKYQNQPAIDALTGK